MSNLYETIKSLCDNHHTTLSELCKETNISRGILTDLKMGRKKTLSAMTLSKIAEHFGVSVEYLLNNGETKEPSSTREINPDDIKFALFGTTDITDGVMEDVIRYARFLREQENSHKPD